MTSRSVSPKDARTRRWERVSGRRKDAHLVATHSLLLTGMWVPKTTAELERAAGEPLGIQESVNCDCKLELPAPHKNRDLAADVAAMANEGGVLVYGVGEDSQGRAKVLNPFTLAGAAERVDQIVQTGTEEPVYVVIHRRPLNADPDRGYLIVEVPASHRAPHMVIHTGDHRYYRRTPTGNMVMNQAEVEAMFRRRDEWGRRAVEELDTALRREVEPRNDWLATLRLVARPIAVGRPLLAGHARPDSPDRPVLVHEVEEARAAAIPHEVLAYSEGMASRV